MDFATIGVQCKAPQTDPRIVFGKPDARPHIVDIGHLTSAAILVEIKAERRFGIRPTCFAPIHVTQRHRKCVLACRTQCHLVKDRHLTQIGQLKHICVKLSAKRAGNEVSVERAAGLRFNK